MNDKLVEDYFRYNPDGDTSNLGRVIAEKVMRRLNGDYLKISDWVIENSPELKEKKAAELIFEGIVNKGRLLEDYPNCIRTFLREAGLVKIFLEGKSVKVDKRFKGDSLFKYCRKLLINNGYETN